MNDEQVATTTKQLTFDERWRQGLREEHDMWVRSLQGNPEYRYFVQNEHRVEDEPLNQRHGWLWLLAAVAVAVAVAGYAGWL